MKKVKPKLFKRTKEDIKNAEILYSLIDEKEFIEGRKRLKLELGVAE